MKTIISVFALVFLCCLSASAREQGRWYIAFNKQGQEIVELHDANDTFKVVPGSQHVITGPHSVWFKKFAHQRPYAVHGRPVVHYPALSRVQVAKNLHFYNVAYARGLPAAKRRPRLWVIIAAAVVGASVIIFLIALFLSTRERTGSGRNNSRRSAGVNPGV